MIHFTWKYEIEYFSVWKICEMKINNLLVNVNIFSLCQKETRFQTEFQHCTLYGESSETGIKFDLLSFHDQLR